MDRPETESDRLIGSSEVREFYEQRGWKATDSGRLLDTELFGVKDVGPICREAYQRRVAVVRQTLAELGSYIRFVECGCGGNPATYLADLVASYTAMDFSTIGLGAAREQLEATGKPAQVIAADLCRIPLADGSFDAAYSAHALYHIPDPAAQATAFDEILRIVRPGGLALFILANPRPLAFPIRLLKRLIADTPAISALANKIRPRPPLPYRPMTLSWMRRHLSRHGKVSIRGYAVASVWFEQNVSERNLLGRLLWRAVRWIEARHPAVAARAGNFVLIAVRKSDVAPRLRDGLAS